MDTIETKTDNKNEIFMELAAERFIQLHFYVIIR